MKKTGKKWISLIMVAVLAGTLAGCGSNDNPDTSGARQEEPAGEEADGNQEQEFVTWDYYCQQSPYQGVQGGWYGKILKDKLNIELNLISPIASGGGDSLYQTRSVAGNLGDIVCLDYTKMKECVENGLLLDLTPYLDGRDSINQYQKGIDNLKEYIGNDGIYAIPTNMSYESPTKIKLDNGMVNETTLMPWDYYKELDMPEIDDTDELLDVLAQMQENHPTSDVSGGKTYAFSIFKDWDWRSMAMAERITLAYGYAQTTDSVFTNADCSKTQLLTDNEGAYYKALKLLFDANQRGLVDPDSSAQDYATMSQKVNNKEVLYVWYPWMASVFNNVNNKTGEGYAYIPVATQRIVTNGYNPYGSDGMCIGIGVNAKDPERIMDYLEWSCTPEAISYYSSTIVGLSYELVDGKPVRTDWGKNATTDTPVPEEYGGGTWGSGTQQFNTAIASKFDTNPETGEPYDSKLWSSYLEDERTQQDNEWAERFGAYDPQTYLEVHDMVEVIPGNAYVAEGESMDLTNARNQCHSEIIQASWKMVFAESEEEFSQIWESMKENLTGMGFDDVVEADMQNIEKIKAARQAAIAE